MDKKQHRADTAKNKSAVYYIDTTLQLFEK